MQQSTENLLRLEYILHTFEKFCVQIGIKNRPFLTWVTNTLTKIIHDHGWQLANCPLSGLTYSMLF